MLSGLAVGSYSVVQPDNEMEPVVGSFQAPGQCL